MLKMLVEVDYRKLIVLLLFLRCLSDLSSCREGRKLGAECGVTLKSVARET